MSSNPNRLVAVLFLGSLALAGCAARPAAAGIYYWRTTLDWSPADSGRLTEAGVGRVGLRLFDWGIRGPEGPLLVKTPLPRSVEVVPVVYITLARLEAWAADPHLDPEKDARNLYTKMGSSLAEAWPGTPRVWQLDADWSGRTREAWFAVARAFGTLVHGRGARFEVTVRLHQYRDRGSQGIPPADQGVLMVYGTGDQVLDPQVVDSYVRGPAYPLPLVVAYPDYTQVRQYNGYGRLVALFRLETGESLPLEALEPTGPDRYTVFRRADLGGRTLLAHDSLVVDRVTSEAVAAVASLPGIRALLTASGEKVWVFDYNPEGWEALIHGPLAPHFFPR